MAIDSIGKSGTPAPLPAPPQGHGPVSASAPAPAPAKQHTSEQVKQPSSEQVRQTVEAMKQVLKPIVANALDFSIDKESGKTVVRVTDAETGDMIRQIPSEELLAIAHSLDKLQGILLKQKA